MSKWILMPDSFKGTMSSLEICRLMREALLRHVPDAEVVSIPVADGGEGSVEAFLAAMGGHRVEVPCTGPDFRKISGFLRSAGRWLHRRDRDGRRRRPAPDGGPSLC